MDGAVLTTFSCHVRNMANFPEIHGSIVFYTRGISASYGNVVLSWQMKRFCAWWLHGSTNFPHTKKIKKSSCCIKINFFQNQTHILTGSFKCFYVFFILFAFNLDYIEKAFWYAFEGNTVKPLIIYIIVIFTECHSLNVLSFNFDTQKQLPMAYIWKAQDIEYNSDDCTVCSMKRQISLCW